MSEQFDDIARAIFNLRTAFLKHGLSAPKAIELGDYADGVKFRYVMSKELMLEQPRMGETQADAQWVCNFMGLEILMPAHWRNDMPGKPPRLV